MHPVLLRRTFLGWAAVVLATGCSTTYDGPRSGFLPDNEYSMVKKSAAPGGGDRYAYISENFTPANYHALIIAPLVFYPEPQPNEYVTAGILTQIRTYADESLRTKIGQRVKLVADPGPGVAVLKIGVTAAGAETRSLKFYQFIPIGLVITGAVAVAQGGLPKDSTVAFESEISDSVTHQALFVSIRGGTGERVERNEQGQHELTLKDLQPLIDKWTDAAAEQLTNYVSAR